MKNHTLTIIYRVSYKIEQFPRDFTAGGGAHMNTILAKKHHIEMTKQKLIKSVTNKR